MMADHAGTSDARATAPADTTALATLLAGWLPRQRWFAGRGPLAVAEVSIAVRAPVARVGDAVFEHLLLRVAGDDEADPPCYQLWLGARPLLPERLAHAEIGTVTAAGAGALTYYDALHDTDLTSLILRAIAQGTSLGPVTTVVAGDAELDTAATGMVLTAEQSNTSVVYGDFAIMKVFRRLEPGPNPDAEVHAELAGAAAPHVARLVAELTGELNGEPTSVGVVTEFFANSADGWQMATASVRDLMAEGDLRADEVGGDFAAEAHRLGAAVARVHAALADAFGTTTVHGDELRSTVRAMAERARRAAATVPELAGYVDAIVDTFDQAGGTGASLTVQRIHGDLHLGQVLRTLTGWVVIDFEGEPSRPLRYRRAMHSALRDIAGMLRSFDYAALHLLPSGAMDSQHSFRAAEWAGRNRRHFCDGYASAASGDPRNAGILLRAFELDKAVYEVVYEHQHRPAWLPIPLHAIDQLIGPTSEPSAPRSVEPGGQST